MLALSRKPLGRVDADVITLPAARSLKSLRTQLHAPAAEEVVASRCLRGIVALAFGSRALRCGARRRGRRRCARFGSALSSVASDAPLGPSFKPVHRVAIVGGTHGNEATGVAMVRHFRRHPEEVDRDSLHTLLVIANVAAVEQNVRYVGKDLNRCFGLHDLDGYHGKPACVEELRAQELNAILGPKGSDDPKTDFIIDLHNTTSNCGIALMMAPGDVLAHEIAQELAHMDAELRIVEWTVADCLDKRNKMLSSGTETTQRVTVPVFKRVGVVSYPLGEDGEIIGMVHPDLQSSDFTELKDGDPLFLMTDGSTRYFQRKDHDLLVLSSDIVLHPLFVNEAAYYESAIAFALSHRAEVHLHSILFKGTSDRDAGAASQAKDR